MKRLIILLFLSLIFSLLVRGQAKYVFFIIGDGMGLGQVNATEMYLAELENRIGIVPLLFSQFPAVGYTTTYSSFNGVTDSAAAGTALASGHKSKNGGIGVDSTLNSPVPSIAERAKNQGFKVGIVTNVSIDHATPASFYAHRASRSMNYEIALDLIDSDFDFFGGAGFVKPETRFDKTVGPSIFPLIEQAGYTLAYGYDDYHNNAKSDEKVILMNNKGESSSNLPYAIDRKESDLTLAQITECAINTLTNSNDKGFFLMIEGGQIDWACHANDAASTFHEILDLNDAVKVAYQFYMAKPDETLIIVTADHETGGLVLGNGRSELNLKALQHQKVSQGKLTFLLKELREKKNQEVTWQEIKEFLGQNIGLWDKILVSENNERIIYQAYVDCFVKGETADHRSLYQSDEKLAATAISILNKIAMIGWTSGSHSADYVPVFAIGNGSELFNGKMDNTDIPKRIIQASEF